MDNIKVIRKNTKKLVKNSFFRAKFIYTDYYEKTKIIPKTIMIQSYDGSSISSNEYYILLELNKYYKDYKKIVVSRTDNRNEIIKFLKSRNIENVEVVVIHSKRYCKALATSQYLINNSTFPTYFIKRKRTNISKYMAWNTIKINGKENNQCT